MEDEKKLPVIPDDEVVSRLEKELPEWYLEGRWIRRKFNTDGWPTTLMLVNAIGYLSEAAWHHPDLEVTWGKVWVKLRTHASGGITDRDFAVAKMIEKAAVWRPEEGSAMEGTPNKWVR
jgi:4a-hydroxytetrahydrobiopterin dehydratase